MKKVFSLFLCLACFLSVGMLGGCSETDLSGVQNQIDELNATISALEDRLSAAEGNNTELQDQLNQATAKLAALEGKINGETIEYLNEGEKATFVNNGIKLFDIQVMKAKYSSANNAIDFNFESYINCSDPFVPVNNISACIIDKQSRKSFLSDNHYYNETVDNIYRWAPYSLGFAKTIPHKNVEIYIFSNNTLFAAYQINFVQI